MLLTEWDNAWVTYKHMDAINKISPVETLNFLMKMHRPVKLIKWKPCCAMAELLLMCLMLQVGEWGQLSHINSCWPQFYSYPIISIILRLPWVIPAWNVSLRSSAADLSNYVFIKLAIIPAQDKLQTPLVAIQAVSLWLSVLSSWFNCSLCGLSATAAFGCLYS